VREASREDANLVIVFEAAPNKAYEIRSGTSLTSGFPTLEQTIPATPTGGIETVTIPSAPAPRFYRIELVP